MVIVTQIRLVEQFRGNGRPVQKIGGEYGNTIS